MNICLVTAFPPSRHGLNEYGFHIARELSQQPGLKLTILADDLESPEPELPEYSVIRCWAFNKLTNPVRLLRAIHSIRPDIVWYNIGFASFGGSPLPAFIGLAIPALTRLRGCYTHVTLHQLVETVDLKDAGVKSQMLYRVAGAIATHMLLSANSISVLLPAYRRILRERYHRGSVYVRAHGILSGRPEYPDLSKRGNPTHRILAFGKWGTYKRLELLISGFYRVAEKVPSVRLVIAGGDHPKTPGYVASIAERFKHDPRIAFTGYVPEDAIGPLFQSTSIAVMPYSSSAGSSGVAHLACEYGVPIVASDISDFRELAAAEAIAMDLYETGNVQSLADHLVALLQSPERLELMAKHNFSAALRMSMPEIIRQYIRSFDLQHRVKLLRTASRFRRLPRWMPLRPVLSRRVGQKFLTWHDSQLPTYWDASTNNLLETPAAYGTGYKPPKPGNEEEVEAVDNTLPLPRVIPTEGGSAGSDSHQGTGHGTWTGAIGEAAAEQERLNRSRKI